MINRVSKIDKDIFPEGFSCRILHKGPYVVTLKHLLTKKEIDTLLKMAEGKFKKSTIIVDDKIVHSTYRTSETAYVTHDGHKGEYPKPIDTLLKKVCYLTGCKRSQVEGLMVVKYEEGQAYYDHHDYFEPEFEGMIKDGGQRIATFFCYLNTLDRGCGGETEMPELEIKSRPVKGSALFWWNTKKDGTRITETLHRGNPIIGKKTKYGLNIWIRERGW